MTAPDINAHVDRYRPVLDLLARKLLPLLPAPGDERHRDIALKAADQLRRRLVMTERGAYISSWGPRGAHSKPMRHCHPYHAVVLFFGLQSESPENGNFPDYGWRLSEVLDTKVR